ncbi:NAD-binding protein [Aliidiomarina sp. Khilg15.8]
MDDKSTQGIDIRTLRVLFYAALSFVLLFTLGVFGFWSLGVPLLSAFYYSVQMVVLDAPDVLHEGPNWAVLIAAFTLPLYPAAALLGLVGAAIGVQSSLVRLQFRPRDHVFLGTGRLTASLVDTLKAQKKLSILAVDIDTDQKHARRVMQCSKAMLLRHDINDSFVLRKLRLKRAKCVYIFTGDDDRNLEIARKIIALFTSDKGKARLPRLVINVESADMLVLATEEDSFQAYQQKGGILWFSAPQQSARELLKQHPPRLTSSLDEAEPLHVGIVGQQPGAEALVLQVVKQSACLTDRNTHITLFGESAERFQHFMASNPVLLAEGQEPEYGQVVPLVSVHFVQVGSQGLSPQAIRDAMEVQAQLPLQVLYISEDTDYRCLTSTLRAKQAISALSLPTRLVTRLTGSQFNHCAEAQDALKNKHQALKGVAWFHGVFDVFDEVEAYPGETADAFGLLIHAAYSAIYHGEPLTANLPDLQARFEARLNEVMPSARAEWQSTLREDFRASSRQSGDHLFVKLRELGFELSRCAKAGGASEQDIAEVSTAIEKYLPALLRMEHRRFVTERLIDGWLAHPDNDKQLKLNRTITPFDKLPESEAFKDEVIVRVIPTLLRHPLVRERYVLRKR